jgi:hypothetical protein
MAYDEGSILSISWPPSPISPFSLSKKAYNLRQKWVEKPIYLVVHTYVQMTKKM